MGGMAGTYGSLAALPLCYASVWLARHLNIDTIFAGTFAYLLIIVNVFTLGTLIIKRAEKAIGPRRDWHRKVKTHDLNQTVIDEVWGMLISCAPIVYFDIQLNSQESVVLFFLAFAYFRIFDIVKIWPAKVFDRMCNSFGIMMDDGIAGIYAMILLIITYNLF